MLTAILAVIHLKTRTPETEGEILINGKSISISDLDFSRVTGTIVNGKGEEKQIDSQGILLSDVCGNDFSKITATASDEYSTEILPEDSENAYIILTDDGSLRLIVFGDSNAKRDVKNLVRIDFV